MSHINLLIEKLKQLESVPGMDKHAGAFIHKSNISHDVAKALLTDIDSMADDVLITDTGQPNYDNIAKMKQAGFRVGPGEKDSFGWLSGIITTKVGKITFG